MHRRIKGLLSLTLVFVMVTATAAPVLADELVGVEQQPAEEQPIIELVEIEPETAEPVQEQNAAEPVEQPVAEAALVAEQPVEEPSITEIATIETETVVQEQNAAEPVERPAEEQPIAEVIEPEMELAEQNVPELELLLDSGLSLDDLYDMLTDEQKMFEVYSGTQPLIALLEDADLFAKLGDLVGGGVVPDSENLDIQAGTMLNAMLESRDGDSKFYRLSGWQVWKVDSNGMPESIAASHSSLSRVATAENFKKSAYIANAGTGTAPVVLCSKPILEPTWSTIPYPIPVYGADGTMKMTISVNAENYNNITFPDSIQADYWKLIYNDTEYRLNTASEIWTNTTNGIGTVGRDFDETKAKLQAYIDDSSPTLQAGNAEFSQPSWYVGEEKPAPVVSSATNGVENITYYYKEREADDSAYATVVPDKVGAYTAKAVFAAVGIYNEVVKTADFEILQTTQVVTDTTPPVISGVSNGVTYYGDQTVKVTDENLSSVTVNGTAVEVLNNEANLTLNPSDDVYQIIAEDTAGNRTQYTVEVWETWVRDGISTDGKKKLRQARLYKLGSGQWTVDGDTTVYQGNGAFYVKTGGEYDFKKK